jgi:hypothetical protein
MEVLWREILRSICNEKLRPSKEGIRALKQVYAAEARPESERLDSRNGSGSGRRICSKSAEQEECET